MSEGKTKKMDGDENETKGQTLLSCPFVQASGAEEGPDGKDIFHCALCGLPLTGTRNAIVFASFAAVRVLCFQTGLTMMTRHARIWFDGQLTQVTRMWLL